MVEDEVEVEGEEPPQDEAPSLDEYLAPSLDEHGTAMGRMEGEGASGSGTY